MWAEPVSLGLVEYDICVNMIELLILVVCDSSKVRSLGPKGSQTPQMRLTVYDYMFACWLVML